MNDSNESQQIIDEKYIKSLFNDRNSLLICLHRLHTKEMICHSNHILLEICGHHFDDYVKYFSTKVIINYVIEEKLNLEDLCGSECWHCFSHFCQFLSRLFAKTLIEDFLGSEFLVNHLLNKLSELSQSENLCKNHCFCYICETFLKLICLTNDQKINEILQKLILLFPKQQKRCFNYKLMDLMIEKMKRSDENPISVKTISVWVFSDNFFTEILKLSDDFHSFGGKYLSNNKLIDNEFGCDVVLLRQSVLLFLLTLSSDTFLKCNSEVKNQLKKVSQFVRTKSDKFDGKDWLIKLFIEEDEQLLSAVYCLIRLGDNYLSHFHMNALIESIGCDSSVLLDMLCDEQTATLLLKLLLIFLKLNDISTNISVNVKNVLLDLRDKMKKLTAKQLFPYSVKPLMKLLNKLSS